MKYHRYDVPDVDIFNVFYHTHARSETETDFSQC
jgi:hypothetical protein